MLVGVELTIQDLVNEQFEGGKVKMFDNTYQDFQVNK